MDLCLQRKPHRSSHGPLALRLLVRSLGTSLNMRRAPLNESMLFHVVFKIRMNYIIEAKCFSGVYASGCVCFFYFNWPVDKHMKPLWQTQSVNFADGFGNKSIPCLTVSLVLSFEGLSSVFLITSACTCSHPKHCFIWKGENFEVMP